MEFDRQNLKCNEQGQSPDLRDEANEEALVDLFGHPRPDEQLHNEERVGRDRKQIGLEGIETKGFAGQGDVGRFGGEGNLPGQTEKINGPHIKVGQRVPQRTETQALTVVHCSLARVVQKNSCDQDVLLPLCEPAVFGSKHAFQAMSRCLSRRRRQVEPGQNTNQSGQGAFNRKKISPTCAKGCMLAEMEDTKREESSNDGGSLIGSPEPGETLRELGTLVVVAQVQDHVRNESVTIIRDRPENGFGCSDLPSFNQSQQESGDEEFVAVLQGGLRSSDGAPSNHLNRDPDVRSQLLADELGWEFRKQKGAVEDSHSIVIVVCRELQIR